jgi:hypothetical protein
VRCRAATCLVCSRTATCPDSTSHRTNLRGICPTAAAASADRATPCPETGPARAPPRAVSLRHGAPSLPSWEPKRSALRCAKHERATWSTCQAVPKRGLEAVSPVSYALGRPPLNVPARGAQAPLGERTLSNVRNRTRPHVLKPHVTVSPRAAKPLSPPPPWGFMKASRPPLLRRCSRWELALVSLLCGKPP